MVDHSSSDIDMVDFDAADASSPGGSGVPRTAYLTRRMAALPQPSNKLVIKPFKAKPTLPSNFEENTWAILKPAISSIFRNQPLTGELEILYQAVTDLCVHKMSGSLYQQIKRECEAHISTALRSLSDQIQIKPMAFLSAVENSWKDFSEHL